MDRVGGIFIAATGIVVGLVASMTTMQLSDSWSYALFGLAGVLFVVGVVMTLWKKQMPPALPVKQAQPQNPQQAHIEVGTAGKVVLEDNVSKNPLFKGGTVETLEARNNRQSN